MHLISQVTQRFRMNKLWNRESRRGMQKTIIFNLTGMFGGSIKLVYRYYCHFMSGSKSFVNLDFQQNIKFKTSIMRMQIFGFYHLKSKIMEYESYSMFFVTDITYSNIEASNRNLKVDSR